MCFHFSSAISSSQFEEEDVLMSDQITNYRVPHACACDLFLFVKSRSHCVLDFCLIIFQVILMAINQSDNFK